MREVLMEPEVCLLADHDHYGRRGQRQDVIQVSPGTGFRCQGYACLSLGFAMHDLGHHVVPARVGSIAEKLLGPPLHRKPESGRLVRIVAVTLKVAEVSRELAGPDVLVEPPAQELHDLVSGHAATGYASAVDGGWP